MFFENNDDDELYTVIDKYLYNEFFGYKDSYYNYYIHANETLFKKVSTNTLLDIMMYMIQKLGHCN